MNVGQAASALLRGVGDADWPRLLTGARDLMALVLAGDPPESLVAWVLADGDPGLLSDLAGSESALKRDPGLADRLVALLPPTVLWDRMLLTRRWEYRHWETLLRRADPADPGWAAIDPERSAYELPFDLISVLAHSPLPGHYLASRVTSRRCRLTEREQVHALARIHAAGGVDDGRYQPEVTARFRAAAATPGGIEALLAEVDGADAAIAALRSDVHFTRLHARERPDLDWSRIASAHLASPFSPSASAALAARGDCPADVRIALYRSHPAAVAEKAAGPFAPLFAVPGTSAEQARGARRLISRLREEGRAEELVADGRPATAVLDIARRPGDRLDAATWLLTPVHTLIRPILAATVGDDPAAWRSLRRLLKQHTGTVRELCEAATAAPDLDGPWPEAAPLPRVEHRSAPIGARKAFLVLLDAAPVDTHIALFPHLDARTLADLFAHGVWRPEWFDHVVGHGTPGQRLAFARTSSPLTLEQVQRLLDLGEPGVGPALLVRQRMTTAQIERILEDLDRPPVPRRPEVSERRGPAVRADVATGRVTWADVLREERPAASVLGQVHRAHHVDGVPALREVVGGERLTTEALLLTLRMLDGFEGTVPELLATARVVTGAGYPESAP